MERRDLKIAWYVLLVAILAVRIGGLVSEAVALSAIGAVSVALDAVEAGGRGGDRE